FSRDWSSDVCSSDLAAPPVGSDDGADERRATAAVPATAPRGPGGRCGAHSQAIESAGSWCVLSALDRIILRDLINCIDIFALAKIGRASCREREERA